jgi:capsular polysaccharide biosynthesis protein
MILLLALLAGSAAFVMTRNAVDTYEREAVFVLRPSDELDDAQIPDAVRGISQQDAQLVQTVSRVIETERFLRLAFVRGAARLPDDAYVLTSTITPGSDVISVLMRGPDPEILAEVTEAFAEEASDWVSGVYRAYELELLEVTASDTPVSASPIQSIVLATLLGLLLGIGSVFAELKARERMGLVSAQLTSADQRAGGPPQGGPQRGSVRVYSGNADVTDVPRPTDAGTSPSVAQKKR